MELEFLELEFLVMKTRFRFLRWLTASFPGTVPILVLLRQVGTLDHLKEK